MTIAMSHHIIAMLLGNFRQHQMTKSHSSHSLSHDVGGLCTSPTITDALFQNGYWVSKFADHYIASYTLHK